MEKKPLTKEQIEKIKQDKIDKFNKIVKK